MTVGDRIDAILRERRWSQSELARRTGIPQTTINSLIRRGSRASPHLVNIARELGVTPAYLTGDTPNRNDEFPTNALSNRELELLTMTRSLPESDRQLVSNLIFRLAQGPASKTLHDRQQPYFGEGEKRNGTHG